MRIPKRDQETFDGKSFEGQLLVASAGMNDPRFAQSVILILHHNQHGAMGIVLNRPLGEKPKAALQKIMGPETGSRDFLAGGPVSGPMIAIALTPQEAGDLPQAGSVVVIKEPQHFEQLKNMPKGNLLVFIGHAGWSAGQLEQELKEGVWHRIPARVELLFGHEREAMWAAAMEEVGMEFYREVLGITNIPADPTWN